MFFSNSFSDTAVDRAAHWIRFLENLQFLLTEVQEAEHQDVLIQFYQNQHLGMFNQKKIESAKRFLLFQNGIFLKVLEHIFDGSQSDFKKFEKESILKAGNYGFGANDGKTLYKDYLKCKAQFSEYKNSGIDWAEEFYIPTIIDQGLSIEDVEEYINNPSEDEFDEEHEYELDGLEEEEEEEEENKYNQNESKSASLQTGDANSYKEFISCINNNEQERFDLYADLWNLESNGKAKAVLNEKFSRKAKGLNFQDYDSFPEDLLPLWHEHKIYRVHTDEQLLFALPNLIFEILNSCNFDAEIVAEVPVHVEVTKTTYSYPEYANLSFFKVRDLCLSNKLSFKNIGSDFPDHGRLLVDANLDFNMKVLLRITPDSSIVVFSQDIFPQLKSLQGTNYSKRKKKSFKPTNAELKALVLQDLESIKHQLDRGYRNPTYLGLMGLEERLDNQFTSSHKFHNDFKKAKKTYLKTNEPTRTEILDILNNATLTITGYTADDDGQHDHYFNVGNNFFETQLQFYEKTGNRLDAFDVSVLQKLEQNGVRLDVNELKKGLGICPLTVSTALRLERLIAPYFLNTEQKQKYKKLREPIEDKYSFDLEALTWEQSEQ
ncbi:hypothetical protein OAU07_07220 [Alphaproteobacteria bacterium]|nr:hypothetical protein [Alphaproteobacteria bacterium]